MTGAWLLWIGCLALMSVYGCSGVQGVRAQGAADVAQIEADMKARLERVINDLEDPAEKEHVVLVNTTTGYEYSQENGLVYNPPLHPDSGGYVTFPDGHRARVRPRTSPEVGEVSPRATYEPYRRVLSNTGYRKAEATVDIATSGDTSSLPPGASACNYFGISRYGICDHEVGLYGEQHPMQPTQKLW